MDTIKLILDYIVIPLLVWLYTLDKRLTISEAKLETVLDFKKEMKTDVIKLFEKLDNIKSEIHDLTKNYVLKNDCVDCKSF